MNEDSYTTTVTIDRPPAEVFEAINNVRGWWSEEVVGDTDGMYVITSPRDELTPVTPQGGGLYFGDGRSFVPGPTTRLVRGDQSLQVSARRSRAEAERRLRAVSRAGRLASWRGETGAASGAD